MVSGIQCEYVCVCVCVCEFTLCVDSETVLPGGSLGGVGLSHGRGIQVITIILP